MTPVNVDDGKRKVSFGVETSYPALNLENANKKRESRSTRRLGHLTKSSNNLISNQAQEFTRRRTMNNSFIAKSSPISYLLSSQNLLNLSSSKQLAAVERIQECKTFGKFLYERKQFEEAQKQFEEALRFFKDLMKMQLTLNSQARASSPNKQPLANGTGSTSSLLANPIG